jgi:hypothetical protein
MKRAMKKGKGLKLTTAPAYFDSIETMMDEAGEMSGAILSVTTEILHAEPRAFEKVKTTIRGHGEQTVLPDDCEFGDNELCYVET